MIQFRDVSKTYAKGTQALSHMDIEIRSGEFVFFVGESGAGKTTAIKLLLKEIEPSQGQVIVNNRDLSQLKQREIPFYRRTLGVVFQDFRLLRDKTVYENVAFAMEIIEAREVDIERQVPIILEMVGLESKANAYPHELSGGEQQRVTLARAMVNNPSILIADEPTGNLDPQTSKEIMRILNMINKRGTTIIMATHAMDIVNTMQKRVVLFKRGRIISDQLKGDYANEA